MNAVDRLESVARQLTGGANVIDRRKGRDLLNLAELQKGPWRDRCSVTDIGVAPRRQLLLTVQLNVNGLAYGDAPYPRGDWKLAVVVGHRYPLEMPNLRFLDPTPYNPHMLDSRFLPDEASLPPELRPYVEDLRAGTGGCCFLETAQWTAALSHDLAFVIWQASRILTGNRLHMEAASLNQHARDYYLRHADQFPLGPALTAPSDAVAEAASKQTDGAEQTNVDDEAMQWF